MKPFHLTKAVWMSTFAISLSMPLAMPVQAQVKIGFGTNYSTGTTYGTAKTYGTGTTYGGTAYGTGTTYDTTKTYGGTAYGTGTTYGTTKSYGGTAYGTTKSYGGTAYGTTKSYGGISYGTAKTYGGISYGTAKTYGGISYGTYNTGTNGTATTNSIDMMNETRVNGTSKNDGVTTHSTSKTYSTARNYAKTTYQGTIYGISKNYKTPKTNSLNIKNSNGKNSGGVKNGTQKKNGTSKNYGGMVLSNNATRASLIKEAKNYQKTNTPTEVDRFDWSWLNWGGLFSLSGGVVALFSYRLPRFRSKLQHRALTRRSGFRSYTFMLSPKLSPASQNRLRGNHILWQRDRAFNQPSRSRSYTVKLSPQLSAARQTSASDSEGIRQEAEGRR